MIVVDTNLIVGFSLKGPHSDLARAVRRKDSHWIAPFLWESEFRNVMLKMIRGGVLGHEKALEAYQLAKDAVQSVEISTAGALRVAFSCRRTVGPATQVLMMNMPF